MKKRFKFAVLVTMAATLLFAGGGCASSAYDVAVENGYQGTETEWLETLRGKEGGDGKDLTANSLYESAKANGFEGRYFDFCRDVLDIDVKENNDVETIAKNTTSIVEINCGFAKTVQSSGYLPGFLGGFTQTQYYSSAGAGVIIELDKEKGDALVVTNYHVIQDASANTKNGVSNAIYLYTYGAYNGFSGSETQAYEDRNGDGIKAEFVGGAAQYDIALLRVKESETLKNSIATAAVFAESSEVSVGEKVYAIGNPNARGIAVTQGLISFDSEWITMLSQDGQTTTDYRVMRTDAAINGGNSGGGLFNVKGELIGITNAKSVKTDIDNVGYALPGVHVRNLCQNILRSERTYGDNAAHVATLGVTVGVSASKGYYDADGNLRIKETFRVVQVGTDKAASGIFEEMDSIKAIRINDGEWVEFTREYQLLDELLKISRGDVARFKVVDANGNEKEKTIMFDKDEYFTVYG